MNNHDPVAMSRAAWNVIRSEHQPYYDELEASYRDMLHARAEAVIVDRRTLETEGVFFQFEQEILEQLLPERFHPDNPVAEGSPKRLLKGEHYERHGDPDVGALGTIAVEKKGAKTSATVNLVSEKPKLKVDKKTATKRPAVKK